MRRKTAKISVTFVKYEQRCKHGNILVSLDEIGPPRAVGDLVAIWKCDCRANWQCVAPYHYGFRLEEPE